MWVDSASFRWTKEAGGAGRLACAWSRRIDFGVGQRSPLCPKSRRRDDGIGEAGKRAVADKPPDHAHLDWLTVSSDGMMWRPSRRPRTEARDRRRWQRNPRGPRSLQRDLGSALARPAKDGRCWNEGLDTNGAITEARLIHLSDGHFW